MDYWWLFGAVQKLDVRSQTPGGLVCRARIKQWMTNNTWLWLTHCWILKCCHDSCHNTEKTVARSTCHFTHYKKAGNACLSCTGMGNRSTVSRRAARTYGILLGVNERRWGHGWLAPSSLQLCWEAPGYPASFFSVFLLRIFVACVSESSYLRELFWTPIHIPNACSNAL